MSNIPKVALLLETSRQYGRQLLRGIARYARLHGPWSLVVSPGHFAQQLPRGRNVACDAAIVRISSPQMAHAIRRSRIPVVALEASLQRLANLNASLGISEIRPDPISIAREAVDHLVDRGFRHFAYCGLADCIWSNARQQEHCRALAEKGFECVSAVVPANLRKHDGEKHLASLARWLRELPKPIGVMACNDDQASKVLDACFLAGIAVPDEVAVIGVDNDELVCELSDPPLSSVALNLEQAGYEAAALLDELMSGRVKGYHEVLVKPRWVVARRSTDVVAQDDRLVAAALRYIHDNALRPIQIPDVVAHAGVSRRSLERRFAAAIGHPLLAELTRCRLDRAKRLLLETDLSIERVADAAGFSATKRMTHAFREFENTLPHLYRQMHKSL
jgi:LacI family transcriptional regulator